MQGVNMVVKFENQSIACKQKRRLSGKKINSIFLTALIAIIMLANQQNLYAADLGRKVIGDKVYKQGDKGDISIGDDHYNILPKNNKKETKIKVLSKPKTKINHQQVKDARQRAINQAREETRKIAEQRAKEKDARQNALTKTEENARQRAINQAREETSKIAEQRAKEKDARQNALTKTEEKAKQRAIRQAEETTRRKALILQAEEATMKRALILKEEEEKQAAIEERLLAIRKAEDARTKTGKQTKAGKQTKDENVKQAITRTENKYRDTEYLYIGLAGTVGKLGNKNVIITPGIDRTKTAKYIFGGALLAGYSFDSGLRIETSLLFSTNKQTLEDQSGIATGKVNTIRTMVGAFIDIAKNHTISPYIGIGGGISFVTNETKLPRGLAYNTDNKAITPTAMIAAGTHIRIKEKILFEIGYRHFFGGNQSFTSGDVRHDHSLNEHILQTGFKIIL